MSEQMALLQLEARPAVIKYHTVTLLSSSFSRLLLAPGMATGQKWGFGRLVAAFTVAICTFGVWDLCSMSFYLLIITA